MSDDDVEDAAYSNSSFVTPSRQISFWHVNAQRLSLHGVASMGVSIAKGRWGKLQEAQLSPRYRATRRVSWNRAKCRTNVRRVTFENTRVNRERRMKNTCLEARSLCVLSWACGVHSLHATTLCAHRKLKANRQATQVCVRTLGNRRRVCDCCSLDK